MCGKFTAMFSWREVVDFSQPLTVGAGEEDRLVTFRVMANVPVIVFDRDAGVRRVVPMRWGFPKAGNWKIPQPIHARSETVNTKHPFQIPFAAGQRGIVVVRTFNEAPDIPGPSVQHTITPGDNDHLGIAFIWDRFNIAALPVPMLAAVMVTVPANKLIATLPTDRMPAALEEKDWSTWLGENDATPADAKATLKTTEGVNWKMAKEEKPPKPKR
jgi:putative SOS response-associated peptidase YedK